MSDRTFVSADSDEYKNSATILCLDTPNSSEFGIDEYEFTTGPNFKGIKLIPPGVHYIFYSAGAKYGGIGPPRSSLFMLLKPGQVRLLRWNTSTEDYDLDEELDQEEVSRYINGVRKFDFDRFLGPYPSDSERWKTLSLYITSHVMHHLESPSKRMSSVYDTTDKELEQIMKGQKERLEQSTVVVSSSNEDPTRYRPKFSSIPTSKELGKMNGSVNIQNFDKSTLCRKLRNRFDEEFGLLGELQFAFVVFLMGQSYDAFEQWKKLLSVLCQCDSAVSTNTLFFYEFSAVLHFQLKQVPSDFFEDSLSADNFLTQILRNYVEITDDDQLGEKMKKRSKKFRKYLHQRFGSTFAEKTTIQFDSDDEYAPVIVEME
ncbi:hypothetical protein PROFUN_09274 [Planoprotostelium fungivorum]|uniref:Protein AAR2 homolog n=1 Tax=Planoprotostelium fungivorum TaxID=1890364 RepID=A0A2P6NKW0_9EUKA|nr:hypothetical protein PROFUN_09274 [Planoprotostelium fungivorum]